MARPEKPHLIWIGVIVLVAMGLGGLAWSLWTGGDGPDAEEPGVAGGGSAPAVDPGPSPEERRAALLAEAGRLLDAERFEDADAALAEAETLGWTDALREARGRLQFREQTYRAAPRAMELRIASVEATEDVGEVFARVSVNGVRVFESEAFEVPVAATALTRERLVTIRTSYDEGATIELLAPGGMFNGPERLLGPALVAPLARLDGGRLEFGDPDAALRRATIAYRPSPYRAGLVPDEPPSPVPADATPSQLVAAAREAIAGDHLRVAAALVARLEREAPEHPDLGFTSRGLLAREAYLEQNRTRVRFTVMEAAADPRPSGKLWATGGAAPSFRAAIATEGRTLAKASGGDTVPFLVPGSELDPPQGNVLELMERGDLALRFVLVDTSPTFGSTEVGQIDLGLTLADLPRGTGTLTVERAPTVLVLPEGDGNRLRRVVLRWSVER